MAHNEGCGDHRRKYRKRKISNGRQRKATNWCGKKRPFTENCQPPAPSNGGERKKKREADVSRKATDDGGQKNNGKFTNGKSEKKITEKILRKTIPTATSSLEQPFSRVARWTPGQLLFYAPGVGHPSWRTSSEEVRDAVISNGRPVLLVDPHPSATAEVLVADGRTEFAASLWELA